MRAHMRARVMSCHPDKTCSHRRQEQAYRAASQTPFVYWWAGGTRARVGNGRDTTTKGLFRSTRKRFFLFLFLFLSQAQAL